MATAWVPFGVFVCGLAVGAVWLARKSAVLLQAERVPPPPALYANVIGSQALIVALVASAAWLANVPSRVLGVGLDTPTAHTSSVAVLGLGAGVSIFLASVLVTRILSRVGVSYSEALRDALEPRRTSEAVTLYGVVLPAVAVGEELLFRGALIGALSAAMGLSPWVPAVASSALFGYAHSAQGRAGVVVTGVLGLVLAGVFIITDSLLAAVVAHYVVNALEFAFGPRLTET